MFSPHIKDKLCVIALRETDIFGNPFYSFCFEMKFQGWWSPVCSGWLPDAAAVCLKTLVFGHLSAGVSFQFSALVPKLFLLKFPVCFQGCFLILKCSWGNCQEYQWLWQLVSASSSTWWLSGFILLLLFCWKIMRHSSAITMLIWDFIS